MYSTYIYLKNSFQILRDLRHDNVNPFVGACVDPGAVCVVSEYCTRGSLVYHYFLCQCILIVWYRAVVFERGKHTWAPIFFQRGGRMPQNL